VLPDYENPALSGLIASELGESSALRPEKLFLEAVHDQAPKALESLGRPISATYLIRDMRFPDDYRSQLQATNPEERLQRYVVLRYPTIAQAKDALSRLKQTPGILHAELNRAIEFSNFYPNDPYFYPLISVNPDIEKPASHFQWGLFFMNFPGAWERTPGHGYVGIIDSISEYSHPDILSIRPQLSISAISTPTLEAHGQHVAGIISANTNNDLGVAGGCLKCSLALAKANPELNATNTGIVEAIEHMVNSGIPNVNMSFGTPNQGCSPGQYEALCNAIDYALQSDTLLVASSGNTCQPAPQYPASHPGVLSVGGMQANGSPINNLGLWHYEGYDYFNADGTIACNNGTNAPGLDGVLAPSKSIVSTMAENISYDSDPYAMCGDVQGQDESGQYGDGYASCTGTSMAAPHVTALAGILRSAAPLITANIIKDIIRISSGVYYGQANFGYGMPNARVALDALMQNTFGLTPLFAFYSETQLDHFYTTVPQMGTAATKGTLKPKHSNEAQPGLYTTLGLGNTLPGYPWFPNTSGGNLYTPRAQVWLFTTPENPIDPLTPLVPLYRLSWKCGDGNDPTVCLTNINHVDFTYTADSNGVAAFESLNYKLDGIEGYLYPKTMSQPPGAVKLMRKYNPDRDDHAIFPESELNAMILQGYTQNSGQTDWLGWVYPY
jgi:hypothetical protein